MFEEIFLAIVQAATEFLPISSSGHLALIGNLVSEPNLFLISVLHFASLLAVLVFTRKEIFNLLSFEKKYFRLWIFLIVATIPAGIFGFFFKDLVERSLSSLFFISGGFFFTGLILLATKFCGSNSKFEKKSRLNLKKSFFIGLMQMFALFPGVSRSGMTISSGIFSGIDKKFAAKFSFLLFIPLALGAMILEFGKIYFSWSLIASFLICFALSLIFLSLLYKIIRKNLFWVFGFYCLAMGIVSFVMGFVGI